MSCDMNEVGRSAFPAENPSCRTPAFQPAGIQEKAAELLDFSADLRRIAVGDSDHERRRAADVCLLQTVLQNGGAWSIRDGISIGQILPAVKKGMERQVMKRPVRDDDEMRRV